MTKKATILVGLPGTGKSTLSNQFKDVWVYSTDRYIEAVANDQGVSYEDVFQYHIEEAKEFNDKALEKAIVLERNLLFDQTNLGKRKRVELTERLKQEGYYVACHVIRKPSLQPEIEEWVRRLESRPGKTIPLNALLSMIENFQLPTIDEGYDTIKVFDLWGTPREATYR